MTRVMTGLKAQEYSSNTTQPFGAVLLATVDMIQTGKLAITHCAALLTKQHCNKGKSNAIYVFK